MSKQLIIMRHAKTEPGAIHQTDFNRNLLPIGVENAQKAGVWLKEHDFAPDKILVSTAKRTRQTAENISLHHPILNKSIVFLDDLYNSSENTILDLVAINSAANVNCMMVIAHNPGVSDLVAQYAYHAGNLVPGAIVVLEANIDDWAEIFTTSMQIIQQFNPKIN